MVLFIFYFHSSEYEWTEYVTKPIALLFLFKFFVSTGKKLQKGLRNGIVFGLLFSILSDLSFLLRKDVSQWFIIGTFIFSLLAISSFAFAFQYTKKIFLPIRDVRSITKINLFLSLLIIAFPISIFIIEDLAIWQYPAILYQILLWILVSQGLKRQDHVNEKSYYIGLFGIVLYSITTMLLTLQNFTKNVFHFKDITVITYFAAQYLIVVGAIFQNPDFEDEELLQ